MVKVDKNFPVKDEVKSRKNNHYVHKEELLNEILEYKKTGVVSNALGKMLMNISIHFSRHPSFRRYKEHGVLEELQGEGIIAELKALKSFNPERKRTGNRISNPVAYMTEVVKNAFRAYLGKMYKDKNFQRDLICDEYHKMHKPFTDEIKKDMQEKDGKHSNEEYLKQYFSE